MPSAPIAVDSPESRRLERLLSDHGLRMTDRGIEATPGSWSTEDHERGVVLFVRYLEALAARDAARETVARWHDLAELQGIASPSLDVETGLALTAPTTDGREPEYLRAVLALRRAESAVEAARTAIEDRPAVGADSSRAIMGPARTYLPRWTVRDGRRVLLWDSVTISRVRGICGCHRSHRAPSIDRLAREGHSAIVCQGGRVCVRPRARRGTRGRGRKVRRHK